MPDMVRNILILESNASYILLHEYIKYGKMQCGDIMLMMMMSYGVYFLSSLKKSICKI